LHLQGSMMYNQTIFPPQLYVYDDLLLYKKRHIFWVREVTISYNQIAQVTLNKGILFSSLQIMTTGTDDIILKYLQNTDANKAKKIIDQKIFYSHAKHHDEASTIKATPTHIEKSLERLKELVARGSMSKREYETRRKELLKRI
jgi:hypothetical protein